MLERMRQVKLLIRGLKRAMQPYGRDKYGREWRKKCFSQIVEAGPPADLTQKESARGYWELVVDLP